MEFENKLIKGIHCSRYVASWINEGGFISPIGHFRAWLRTLTVDGEHLTSDEIRYICNFAGNGKLELEEQVRMYMTMRVR